jgi:hypothetical protein
MDRDHLFQCQANKLTALCYWDRRRQMEDIQGSEDTETSARRLLTILSISGLSYGIVSESGVDGSEFG